MMCSQCQIGRAWDAQGRCRPCSLGNVNLGAPVGASAVSGMTAVPPASPSGRAAPVPPGSSGGACSQCWVGVAWDEEGRCRPCSDGGVRLAPAAVSAEPDEPAADEERPRRWFGERR